MDILAELVGESSAMESVRDNIITLMRAIPIRSEEEALSDTSRALELLVDKVRSFGGGIEELSPKGVAAAFGLEPVEDAPLRAAHAAMAIQKAAERSRRGDGERFTVKIAIHVSDILVGQSGAGAELNADAKRAEWAVLDSMLEGGEPGRILLSAAAAPFLGRRFDLASQPVTEPGAVYRVAGRESGISRARRTTWKRRSASRTCITARPRTRSTPSSRSTIC